MIFPKESEIFGALKENSFDQVVDLNDQPWYYSLGLKTLDDANRITRITTNGDHLQFSQKELYDWIDWFFT